MIQFYYYLERCPSGLRYTLGRGAYPQGTGGSNPPLSERYPFRTVLAEKSLLMSPGAMQAAVAKLRQIGNEATVCVRKLCRRLPGLFRRFFLFVPLVFQTVCRHSVHSVFPFVGIFSDSG